MSVGKGEKFFIEEKIKFKTTWKAQVKGTGSIWRGREALAQQCLQSWGGCAGKWVAGSRDYTDMGLALLGHRVEKKGAFGGHIQQMVMFGGMGKGRGETQQEGKGEPPRKGAAGAHV